jgi:hypothetical protein
MRMIAAVVLSILFAATPAIGSAKASHHTSHTQHSSHTHYANQGGHYVGGHGSSHQGGHYVNPRTGNHYTHHTH